MGKKKKIKISAEKNKNNDEKIQNNAEKIHNSAENFFKIINRVDWILSKRVCVVITLGTTIAQVMPHVIEHKTESKKNIKTCVVQYLAFKLWRFEKGPTNFYYLKDKHVVKKSVLQIVPNFNMKRFHIVTHSNAASFSIKIFFMKLTTFFISNARDIYIKLSRFSESSVEIKFR